MQMMPVKNSKPEVRLRQLLHERGLRFRLHRGGLPGRPDIVFGPAKVAVFLDGCFWHNCPRHCVLPKNNRRWWRKKLMENRARDRRKDRALAKQGWLAIHVWEHENMETAAKRVFKHVKNRLSERA